MPAKVIHQSMLVFLYTDLRQEIVLTIPLEFHYKATECIQCEDLFQSNHERNPTIRESSLIYFELFSKIAWLIP